MLTARVVREGEALVLELAAPHTLAEAAHAMLHVTALVSTSMVSKSKSPPCEGWLYLLRLYLLRLY